MRTSTCALAAQKVVPFPGLEWASDWTTDSLRLREVILCLSLVMPLFKYFTTLRSPAEERHGASQSGAEKDHKPD